MHLLIILFVLKIQCCRILQIGQDSDLRQVIFKLITAVIHVMTIEIKILKSSSDGNFAVGFDSYLTALCGT